MASQRASRGGLILALAASSSMSRTTPSRQACSSCLSSDIVTELAAIGESGKKMLGEFAGLHGGGGNNPRTTRLWRRECAIPTIGATGAHAAAAGMPGGHKIGKTGSIATVCTRGTPFRSNHLQRCHSTMPTWQQPCWQHADEARRPHLSPAWRRKATASTGAWCPAMPVQACHCFLRPAGLPDNGSNVQVPWSGRAKRKTKNVQLTQSHRGWNEVRL